MNGIGAFWGTRVLEVVKRNNSPGLLWKKIKLTSTRKNNAKKRLRRVWQNEAVLRACAENTPLKASSVTSNLVTDTTAEFTRL
ncbi:hypothetical protein HPP92_021263 [Vanilla planifolia]|uniref:Uncharacterized protein n=1 Tax=Vanilla planifolia TaxID=51239 RepID=A0A835PVR2_VANPL|nr:hypothetical protein HPP92_021628 [Vanilla planifolia]KAG0462787.1 hypothetical protein HPP92_021263 [Vanilla planifolia]